MNVVVLVGRLVKDPEMNNNGEKTFTKFSLAVDRFYSDTVDYFNIITWGKQAEHCKKYLEKGNLCAIEGSLESGSYENKEGKKVYFVQVNASKIKFLPSKKKEEE